MQKKAVEGNMGKNTLLLRGPGGKEKVQKGKEKGEGTIQE